jgi:hypothetical protein
MEGLERERQDRREMDRLKRDGLATHIEIMK